jgi:hypothetical protein
LIVSPNINQDLPEFINIRSRRIKQRRRRLAVGKNGRERLAQLVCNRRSKLARHVEAIQVGQFRSAF